MRQIGGMLGEILEAGGSLVKMTGQTLVATPGSLVKTAASQVANTSLDSSTSGEKADRADLKKQQDDFVKDLYGASDAVTSQPSSDQQSTTSSGAKNGKSPEEQQKIEALKQQLKQQLHSQYFQRLTAPPKAAEKPVAEKLEDEKAQERWELQKKDAKKPQDLSVVMASQKTERFRGARG